MIFAPKLKQGDEIRVIAPAKSMRSEFVEKKLDATIAYCKDELGLNVTFGKHIHETDEFNTATLDHRLEDFHDAFRDKNVKGILTVLGGTNSNQLLSSIDYDLVRENPKIFCGLSDITALANGIYTKTGLVTYSGPHFTVFGFDKAREYTVEYFKKCVFENESFSVEPSLKYFDERKSDAEELSNGGYWMIQEGEAEGISVGGNLVTLNLLQGTEYFPSIKDSIVFIEDNHKESIRDFENHLQSLVLQHGFSGVRGIVIGRFQKETGITEELLKKIVRGKKELAGLPIIANADFGHTLPMFTFPIGGKVKIVSAPENVSVEIFEH